MDALEPSQPLDNAQQEHFCRLMAEGKTSQGQTYATAYARDEVDNTVQPTGELRQALLFQRNLAPGR